MAMQERHAHHITTSARVVHGTPYSTATTRLWQFCQWLCPKAHSGTTRAQRSSPQYGYASVKTCRSSLGAQGA